MASHTGDIIAMDAVQGQELWRWSNDRQRVIGFESTFDGHRIVALTGYNMTMSNVVSGHEIWRKDGRRFDQFNLFRTVRYVLGATRLMSLDWTQHQVRKIL